MASGTRERLIEAAGELFYKQGFQAVGLDQVLADVGITKTAFYKHFESKDELILAVLEERDKRDVAEAIAFMRTRGGDDPRRQIVALFEQLAEWFAQPGFRGCLFMNAAAEFPSPNDPINRAARAHNEHLAAEIRLRVAAAGMPNPELITSQLMLVMTGAILSRHANRVGDAGEVARAAVERILGMMPTPARSGAR
jgi:AcrR family transcriptional regulator